MPWPACFAAPAWISGKKCKWFEADPGSASRRFYAHGVCAGHAGIAGRCLRGLLVDKAKGALKKTSGRSLFSRAPLLRATSSAGEGCTLPAISPGNLESITCDANTAAWRVGISVLLKELPGQAPRHLPTNNRNRACFQRP